MPNSNGVQQVLWAAYVIHTQVHRHSLCSPRSTAAWRARVAADASCCIASSCLSVSPHVQFGCLDVSHVKGGLSSNVKLP
jgi:hypothetical protein